MIETKELPPRVSPIGVESFVAIRKQVKTPKDRAIAELRDAIYESKTNSKRMKHAQDILKKHFNMSLVQALDFLHLSGQSQNTD